MKLFQVHYNKYCKQRVTLGKIIPKTTQTNNIAITHCMTSLFVFIYMYTCTVKRLIYFLNDYEASFAVNLNLDSLIESNPPLATTRVETAGLIASLFFVIFLLGILWHATVFMKHVLC